MRKNIILAATAVAATILLTVSCTKQELSGVYGEGNIFTAVINQETTKTNIDSDYKVNWSSGDQISINGAVYSATPDESDATKAVFTYVSGTLPEASYYAIYPASLWSGEGVVFPATQTYESGKFNAPMYAVSETESLSFQNICGVLCFSLKGANKVKSITINANEALCGAFNITDATTVKLTGTGRSVTLDCGTGVQLNTGTSTNFYVYLPPKSYSAGMRIVITDTEGGTFTQETVSEVTVKRNELYTFNWTPDFISPYVEIGGVKWAKKNVGAEKETDYGYYFAWAGTEGYVYDKVNSKWVKASDSSTTLVDGFIWENAPYKNVYESYRYIKYTDYTKTDLEPIDDAATTYLGSDWRMPTSAEFQKLYDACGGTGASVTPTELPSANPSKGIYWVSADQSYISDYTGTAGILFCDGTNKLFLPAAGDGGTTLYDTGIEGYYWSSTLANFMRSNGNILGFNSNNVSRGSSYSRFVGLPVRAVMGPPVGALQGEFSVSATKKVHFSQSNLFAMVDANGTPTVWLFDTRQYFYLGEGEANKTIGSASGGVDLFGWSTAATKYGISTSTNSADYSGDFVDWGKNIGDGSTWRTLSTDEWQYLFQTRTNASSLYKTGVTVCGQRNCLIIAPDGFTGTIETSYDASDWSAAEATGLVCLPAAGTRNGSSVRFLGGIGGYWSSSAYNDLAYIMDFGSSSVDPAGWEYRNSGYSVRLVTDVK